MESFFQCNTAPIAHLINIGSLSLITWYRTLRSASLSEVNKRLSIEADFKNLTGSSNKLAFWRFKDGTTKEVVTGDYTYEGALECLIANTDKKKCKEFPIDIVGLLSFLILVYIAQRFGSVVERICSELSNAMVSLDAGGKMEHFLSSKGPGASATKDTSAGGASQQTKTVSRGKKNG